MGHSFSQRHPKSFDVSYEKHTNFDNNKNLFRFWKNNISRF